jgi:hypothetical protein
MNLFKKILKTEKAHAIVLEVIFIIYILFNFDTPDMVANFVDTSSGKLLVVLLALSMFVAGPIAGILAALAGYTLITRSTIVTGSSFKYADEAEEIKMQHLQSYNENVKTLEEEMVSDMAPIVRAPCSGKASYKPVLDNLNDAAPIDYEGVV